MRAPPPPPKPGTLVSWCKRWCPKLRCAHAHSFSNMQQAMSNFPKLKFRRNEMLLGPPFRSSPQCQRWAGQKWLRPPELRCRVSSLHQRIESQPLFQACLCLHVIQCSPHRLCLDQICSRIILFVNILLPFGRESFNICRQQPK